MNKISFGLMKSRKQPHKHLRSQVSEDKQQRWRKDGKAGGQDGGGEKEGDGGRETEELEHNMEEMEEERWRR